MGPTGAGAEVCAVRSGALREISRVSVRSNVRPASSTPADALLHMTRGGGHGKAGKADLVMVGDIRTLVSGDDTVGGGERSPP